MPQPQPPESDPLLAFFAELETPAAPVQLPEAAKDPPADDLRIRVDRAERQVERALIDISTLKSDQAKLVSAVEEIRRQLSRPSQKPAPVVARPAERKGPRLRTVAAILVLIALGFAMWGLTSTTTYEMPEPPAIESESSNIIEPLPIVEAQRRISANAVLSRGMIDARN